MKRMLFIVAFLSIAIALVVVFVPRQEENTVGLVYIAKAPAIDLAIEGLESRLAELQLEVQIEYANAFGEPKNINTIINSFKQKEYQVVLALTTPCAQIAKQHIKDKPVIFVGVSDPVGANLVPNLSSGYENITGTMSLDPIFENVKFSKQLFPSINKIGIIYSTSESNSSSILKNLEDSLASSELDISLIRQPITQTLEIYRASENLSSKVDAIFLINDNMVFSGSETIISAANKKGIPVFASDIESVKKGALFTYGLNYKDEGIAAANILYDLLIAKKSPDEIPIFINKNYYLHINKKLYQFGIDTTIFESAIIVD